MSDPRIDREFGRPNPDRMDRTAPHRRVPSRRARCWRALPMLLAVVLQMVILPCQGRRSGAAAGVPGHGCCCSLARDAADQADLDRPARSCCGGGDQHRDANGGSGAGGRCPCDEAPRDHAVLPGQSRRQAPPDGDDQDRDQAKVAFAAAAAALPTRCSSERVSPRPPSCAYRTGPPLYLLLQVFRI